LTRRNHLALRLLILSALAIAGCLVLGLYSDHKAVLSGGANKTVVPEPGDLQYASRVSQLQDQLPQPVKFVQTSAHTQKQARAAVDSSASAPPVKTLGNKNAPIAMEVFSDYQCPACRGLFEQTLRPMINDYVAQGKVYLIHRDFPLPIAAHTHSWEAARWANAAAKIGKFQDVDAALFDNQLLWSGSGDIEKYVSATLNATDFKRVQTLMAGSCMNDPGPVLNPANLPAGPSGHACALDNYIEQDVNLGKQVPVTQTPTMAITYKGQKYPATSGLITWPILKEYFDSLLSQ